MKYLSGNNPNGKAAECLRYILDWDAKNSDFLNDVGNYENPWEILQSIITNNNFVDSNSKPYMPALRCDYSINNPLLTSNLLIKVPGHERFQNRRIRCIKNVGVRVA